MKNMRSQLKSLLLLTAGLAVSYFTQSWTPLHIGSALCLVIA